MFNPRGVASLRRYLFHMTDDVLERREPNVLGLEGEFQPLFDKPPARNPASEEGVPDADPETTCFILCVELLPERLEAFRGGLHGHHVADLCVMGERRPVVRTPMDRRFPEFALLGSHQIGDVVGHERGFI